MNREVAPSLAGRVGHLVCFAAVRFRGVQGGVLAASLAAAITGLAGCTVGPRYQPPTPPAGATAPLVSLNPELETTAQPPDAWWKLYSDRQLDTYLNEAFAANDDLKAAEANLSAARAALEAARAGKYPSTTLESGTIYGRDPSTDEILEVVGTKPQTTWLYDDLFDVSYELDLFGRVRRQIEAARADTAAAAAGRDVYRITIAAETTRAYAQICTLGEQLDVARRSYDTVNREAEITRRRRLAGAGSEFDVVRAEALAAQARALISPLEGQRRAALFQLGALLGRTPAHAPAEALGCVTPPRLVALIPIGDGGALLKRRPDIRLADRRLAGAIARVGVATADLYPRIELTGFYGGFTANSGQLLQNAGLGWGVGPKISWAFPNQVAPRARIHQAKAYADAALDQFDETVLQALKETEQALAAYSAELERRQSLDEAQSRARRAFEIAHAQFLAGALPDIDLLTTEQTLISADAAVAASDAVLVQDQISLFKALGGGWTKA